MFPVNIRAVWTSGGRGPNFEEENQDFKKLSWGRISSSSELYTPLGISYA